MYTSAIEILCISLTFLFPQFELAQMSVSYDLENLTLKPEKDAILMEMIHKVGSFEKVHWNEILI